MTQEELLKDYPQKSFTKEFSAKKKALLDLGRFNVDALNAKEEQFKKIFEYDKAVEEIKKIIAQNKKIEMTEQIAEKIKFHFANIGELNHFLGQLNLNDADVNNVFMPFYNHAKGKGLLDKVVKEVVGGVKTPSYQFLADAYIEEINYAKSDLLADRFDEQKIKQATEIANKIIESKKKYEDAAILADNWIKSEGKAVSLSIKDKAEIFNRKADSEHTIKKVRIWLLLSILSGLLTLGIICYFIKTISDQITIGASLIRISAIIVASYYSFLFSQQFLNHRRLYESYKFKAIALTTMEEMIKSFTDQKDKVMILEKAMDNIFNEPYFKEEKLIQQKLIDSAIDIAKKKI